MINKTDISPYLNNLSITILWSISSFFINILPIYFLTNILYAELIVATTSIFLLSQILTLGFSDSLLKYGNSALIFTFLILVLCSITAMFFMPYEVVLSGAGISSMLVIRNYLIKNNQEYKILKFTFLIITLRILICYILLNTHYSINQYLIILYLVPSFLIFLYGFFIMDKSKNQKIKLLIKKDIIFFAITTVVSRFLFSYSNRVGIFILKNQNSYDEIKLFGFLISFLGIYSLVNQSIRNVIIGNISSSLIKTKELYYKLVDNLKKVIIINILLSIPLSCIVNYTFSWDNLKYLNSNISITLFIYLFFLIFGLVPFIGLFNISLRTLNRIDIEIIINIFRLSAIYLSSFYFSGIPFLFVLIFIIFIGEIILAILSNKFLFKWKN